MDSQPLIGPQASPLHSPASDAAGAVFLDATLELVNVAVLHIDVEGRLLRVNPAACALLGYEACELLGKSYMLAAPPEVHAKASRFLVALLDGSPKIPKLWRLRRKDGNFVMVRTSFKALPPLGAVLVFERLDQDNTPPTADHPLSDALTRSQAMLQMVVDNVPALIAYYDAKTITCIFANEAYARANGKTVQWAVGRHCREIIGESAWQVIEPNVLRVIAGETVAYERTLTLPDGGQRRIDVNLIPHQVQAGGQIGVFVLIHDITRHYLAEQAARESEERLRKFASATTEAIVFHREGVIEDGNEALATLLGVPMASLIGRHLLEFMPASEHPQVRENIRLGVERSYLTRVLNAAGQEVPVDTLSRRMVYNGQELRLVVARDVSERQALLKTLARSQAQYQALVDNANDAVLVSVDGVLAYANPSAERMFDVPHPGGLTGRPSLDLVHPQDRALVMDKRNLMLAGRLVEPYEARMICPPAVVPEPDGKMLWCQIYGVRIDWDGRPALLILLADITEPYELRERLREALRQSEAILATTAVGVCMLRNRRHQWVNATLCRMLGFSREELIGRETRIHYPSDDAYEQIGQVAYAQIETDGYCSAEVEMRRKDGSLIWVQIDGRPLGEEDGLSQSVWTYVDITQRKIAEAEMQQTLARERDLGELKTRFVSMASHEFRTPLSTIQTSTELLQHYADRLGQSEREAIFGDIQQSVDRMKLLMENFLAFGRMGTTRAQCQPVPCPLAGTMREFAAEARSADGQRHLIVLEPSIASDLPETVTVDLALLRQIIGNLLNNACKYSAAGKTVRFAYAREGDWLRMEIADEGIGIPEQDLPRLFETFHRASNVSAVQGTGLGLAIVKRAVEAHGGTIEVRSAEGLGSSFVVRLPLGA